MKKLLNVKAVKLQCYGKDVRQTFKVFPPTNIEDLKKQWNNYEHWTCEKNMIPGQLCVSRGLTWQWQFVKVH